jgi:uncharacterized protein (DUF885 family)
MKAIRIMTLLTMLSALVLPLGSCSRGPSADERFVGLANRYLEKARELDPEWATSLGDHRFDNRLTDRSLAGYRRRADLQRAYLDSLDALDPQKLSQTNRIDYRILRNQLEGGLFAYEEIREHEWNPLVYNLGGAIYGLLARDFAPLRERLANLKERLEGIPGVLAAARNNLQDPPRIHTETAIQQNRGTISLIMDDLQPYLEQAPDMKDEFTGVRAGAIAALQAYGRWLEEDLLPRAKGDFRLGDARYRKKLHFTLESDLTKEEILAAAQQDLSATQDAIFATALELHAKFFPGVSPGNRPDRQAIVRKVLDRLAEDRPDNTTIVERARGYLAAATDFVRQNQLVSIPDEPIHLIVMPEYQRGVAVAYCDAPGPLEEHGETFYSIAPTPRSWDTARTESFFREYNDYMLNDLTIHEAMPGHYLQLAHANAFRAPTLVRAIFGSGTFIEGWATYAEQFMVEQGYGGLELKMQQLKMRLRLIINAIIDQKIHTEGMTEAEAMAMMMDEGYQEEGEAAGKWRRACMSSTQLATYYVGNVEVNRIRADYQARAGGDFSLREFHDALLSFGSPAPRYVRELLGL